MTETLELNENYVDEYHQGLNAQQQEAALSAGETALQLYSQEYMAAQAARFPNGPTQPELGMPNMQDGDEV